MTLGLLISSLSWLILAIHPTTVGLHRGAGGAGAR